MCYLKVLDNPKDEVSLLRIINSPPRGIGAKTVENLLNQAVRKGTSVWAEMDHLESTGRVTESARQGVDRLKKLSDVAHGGTS